MLKNVHARRQRGHEDAVPKAVWSDSVAHLGEEPWPAHAVPLFVFKGTNRPRPAYRDETRFTLRDERYINYALRMRCGSGDRYNGGSIGLVCSGDGLEAAPGTEGQLVTVTDIIVMPDNTVILCAVGDLNFCVLRTWMPRGMQGIQLAFIEVEQATAPRLEPIVDTCLAETGLGLFARLIVAAALHLQEVLSQGGPFTVFVPTDVALTAFFGGSPEEDIVQLPNLEAFLACHIVQGRVPFEAMYSGRTLHALDGTNLTVTFTRWPRDGPMVNSILFEHSDVWCRNGVVHSINGVLTPAPAPQRRPRH